MHPPHVIRSHIALPMCIFDAAIVSGEKFHLNI